MAYQSYDPNLGVSRKSMFEFIEPATFISASVPSADDVVNNMNAAELFMPRPMPASVLKLLQIATEENRMNGLVPEGF